MSEVLPCSYQPNSLPLGCDPDPKPQIRWASLNNTKTATRVRCRASVPPLSTLYCTVAAAASNTPSSSPGETCSVAEERLTREGGRSPFAAGRVHPTRKKNEQLRKATVADVDETEKRSNGARSPYDCLKTECDPTHLTPHLRPGIERPQPRAVPVPWIRQI